MSRSRVLGAWRGRLPVVLVAVLAMLLSWTAVLPAQAVTQSLSLVAPASAETGLEFALSGVGYPARAGRVVVVQRLSGRSWLEVARATESSTGRYSVLTTVTSPVAFTYRSLALASPGLAAVASVSRVVTAHSPYLLLTPSRAITAESVRVSGKLPGVALRPVWVQRKSGSTWVTLVKGKTLSTGSYVTSFRAPAVGSYYVRSLAPAVKIAGKVRAAYVSPAKILSVVAQTATLTLPTTLIQTRTGTATLSFTPVRVNRPVALQVLRSGVWTSVATGSQSTTGVASFTVLAGLPATYSYRAWTAASALAAAFAGPPLALVVTTSVPGPVTLVSATPASGSVVLSWTNSVSGIPAGVMIRRAPGATPPVSPTEGDLVVDAASTDTTFTDRTALTAETEYSYALFAHDSAPGYAAAAGVTTTTTAVPGPVTSVGAAPASGSIVLSWTNPVSATLSGVVIRRAAGAIPPATVVDGTLVVDAGGSDTSFTDRTALTAETQYSYSLFAHDATPGYAEAATLTTSTAAVPGPVTSVSANPDGWSVDLSWTNPASATLSGVVIRRAPGAIPPASVTGGTLVGDTGGSATSFTDGSALTPETQYSYALFAHDATPGYAPSGTVTVTTAPRPVTNVSAAPASGSVVLSWTNPASATFTGVVIRRAPGATPPASVTDGTLVVSAGGSATSFTDRTALSAETEYSYALFAHDGRPGYAVAATLTTSTTAVPGPVTSVGANPASGSVVLSWTNPLSATLSGVVIRRAPGSVPPATVTDGTLVGDAGGSATTFTDRTALTPVTEYSYALFAHDATPGFAAAATLTTSTTPLPGPVTSPGAIPDGRTILLSWANPTSPTFTGVMIRRAKGAIPPATVTDGTLVVDAGGSATSFTDAGRRPMTRYSYSFFAHDATPGYSVVATASATTAASPGDPAFAWGSNATGQLGDGTTTTRRLPVEVGTGTEWVSASAGGGHTVAIKADGTMWAWGDNEFGQLGDGTTDNRTAPTQVGTGGGWKTVAAGGSHTVAVRSNGTLWSWGFNGEGELGDNTQINHSVPLQVGTDTSWASVSAGNDHTLAIRTDGTLWAWGDNAIGQLGCEGSLGCVGIPRATEPVQVGTDTGWASVAAGYSHTVAVRTDGTLWAWGLNYNGQLGDGSNTSSSAPVQVGTDSNWASATAGSYHTAAVKSNGTLWSWGYNEQGELGDSTTIDRTEPVQVGEGADWASVTAGYSHTVALTEHGTLWAWGDNSLGQLGDGTVTGRLAPAQVGTDNDWVWAAAGKDHTVALRP